MFMLRLSVGLALFGLSVCYSSCKARSSSNSKVKGYVTGGYSALWPSMPINVCWENHSTATEDLEMAVKKIVTEQYNGRTIVRFSGWEKCKGNEQGIRVYIGDETPHTKGFGAFLNGVPRGLTLNFFYKKIGSDCSKTRESLIICLQLDALHEFGHAVGLRHEHNRPDNTYKLCNEGPINGRGETGAVAVGEYDSHSIMNYCYETSIRRKGLSPALSDGDLATIEQYYLRRIEFKGPDFGAACIEDRGRWESVENCCDIVSSFENRSYPRCSEIYKPMCEQIAGKWVEPWNCCIQEGGYVLGYTGMKFCSAEQVMCDRFGGHWRSEKKCCDIGTMKQTRSEIKELVLCN